MSRLGHCVHVRTPTPKSCSPAGGNGARACCRGSSACSRSRSGTSATRTLHAARDRFGEKPLLYAEAGRRLAFGTDLIACEAMLGETRPVDPAALRALFALRFVPEPWSIAQGIRKLPAGCRLKFDAERA